MAINLVVGQLVSLPLSWILAALKPSQPGTDSFYQYLYSVSRDLISAPAQYLLQRMVDLQAGGGAWEDLSAISGLFGDDLNSAIEELAAHSLVQAVGFEKTYCLHPLTQHFAMGRAAYKSKGKEPPGQG